MSKRTISRIIGTVIILGGILVALYLRDLGWRLEASPKPGPDIKVYNIRDTTSFDPAPPELIGTMGN